MLKKFVVTALAIAFVAVLWTSPAVASGLQNQAGTNSHWTVQMIKSLQYRFAFMFGVTPADDPGDTWGPGDGTGNDGDGPEDGTGYGPGPYYQSQSEWGDCSRTGYNYQWKCKHQGQ